MALFYNIRFSYQQSPWQLFGYFVMSRKRLARCMALLRSTWEEWNNMCLSIELPSLLSGMDCLQRGKCNGLFPLFIFSLIVVCQLRTHSPIPKWSNTGTEEDSWGAIYVDGYNLLVWDTVIKFQEDTKVQLVFVLQELWFSLKDEDFVISTSRHTSLVTAFLLAQQVMCETSSHQKIYGLFPFQKIISKLHLISKKLS